MVQATLRRVTGDADEEPDAETEDVYVRAEAQEVHVRFTSVTPSQELIDAALGWQTLESTGHLVAGKK